MLFKFSRPWFWQFFIRVSILFLVMMCASPSWAGISQQRIVSLAPSATEWIVALGLENSLYGVTEQCDFPPRVSGKSKVGAFMRVSVERVLALKPTDIVAVDGLPAALKQRFTESGARVHLFHAGNLQSFPQEISRLGQNLGVADRANLLAESFRGGLRGLAQKKSKGALRRGLFFVNLNPMFVASSAAWLSELFEFAGVANALAPTPHADLFPRISFEALAMSKADLWVGFARDAREKEQINSSFSQLNLKLSRGNKVKTRIYPADEFQRPGPRLLEAMRQLQGEEF